MLLCGSNDPAPPNPNNATTKKLKNELVNYCTEEGLRDVRLTRSCFEFCNEFLPAGRGCGVLLLEDEMFPVALGELEDDAKPKEDG